MAFNKKSYRIETTKSNANQLTGFYMIRVSTERYFPTGHRKRWCAGKIRRIKSVLTKMNPFKVFFMDFDYKFQDPILNKTL